MKKWLRGIAVTAVVLCLCFTLSGCNMIKDMRAAQVFKNDDGTITYNEQVYHELPPCDTLNSFFSYEPQLLYLTEPDVPVLLSVLFGEEFMVSDDGVFLSGTDYTTEADVYYCREDKYTSVLDQIENGYEAVGYTYSYDVLKDPDTFSFESETYTLTESQAQAVDLVRQLVDPNPQLEALEFENTVYLNRCSADGYFSEEVCMVHQFKGNYYVEEYDYVAYGTVSQVPDEYADEFAALMKKAIDADAVWEEYYDSDDYLTW